MTCPSCERTLERELGALAGVSAVQADRFKKTVRVDLSSSSEQRPDRADMQKVIQDAGYAVLEPRGGSRLPEGKAVASLGIGLLLGALYLFLDHLGVFAAIPVISGTLGFGALFGIGLLTSLHCLAMCGALVLSRTAPSNETDADQLTPGKSSPLAPALLYNGGRMVSYAVTGALAGYLGAAFSFSLRSRFIIMVAAALLMLVFALRNLGIFNFKMITRLLPASVCAANRTAASKQGSLVLGLMNGLMPCGPLQAMQLFALGTGSAFAGAASMLAFGLGTVPLMLGLGAVISLVPRRLLGSVNRASGVLMLVFAIVTAGRAYSFAGSGPALGNGAGAVDGAGGNSLVVTPPVNEQKPAAQIAPGAIRPVMENGVQVIVMPIESRRYPSFVVQKGIPVRWIIRAAPGTLNGCNNAIIIPAYNAQIRLSAGDTIVEFTPDKEGVVPFSCWMGMIRSTFTITGGPL